MTGKRGLAAVLPIGVRQQSVYQRRTPLSERRRHRTRERLAVVTVADKAEAAGRRDIARNAAHAAAPAPKRGSNGRRAASMPVITGPRPQQHIRESDISWA